ncbi:M23 family metallopeptidase [Leekyejoonella antrihumi]|uniref:M23 family metallopeptidase n=1 Tax=Leekyejoonella antrihumi TaxID=1660198 RepID=UPI001644FCBA|nr:M23 family metallopeptidase [Leekyejoonella antrihumi]
MSPYQARHRASHPPVWRRPGVVVPTVAAALATAAVGISALSTGVTPTASATSGHEATVAAANLLGQRQQGKVDTSRSLSRPQNTAQVKANSANTSRAAQRAKALAGSSSAAAAGRQKAEQSATAARSKATEAATTAATAKAAAAKAKGSTSGGWTCAIAGCGGTFTSGFGGRWGTMHLGDDFATPVGTPLRALHSGTVVTVGNYFGMGNRVEIDYGNGVSSIEAHLSSFAVSAGQQVEAGQVVGRSGNTGHSTGPHVHLEIHLNDQPVDPAPWLRAHGIF